MGPFVGKKRREVWRVSPLCVFWMVGKAKNKITFEDDVLSIQRLKSSFACFFFVTKLCIKDGPFGFND